MWSGVDTDLVLRRCRGGGVDTDLVLGHFSGSGVDTVLVLRRCSRGGDYNAPYARAMVKMSQMQLLISEKQLVTYQYQYWPCMIFCDQ